MKTDYRIGNPKNGERRRRLDGAFDRIPHPASSRSPSPSTLQKPPRSK
jgi:hypothetical protein